MHQGIRGVGTRVQTQLFAASLAVVIATGGMEAQAQSRPTLASLQAAVDCLNLPTVVVEVPALATGSYTASGAHLPGNYLVGKFLFNGTLFGPYRNYAVYDFAGVVPTTPPKPPALGPMDLVVGAELITLNRPSGFRSDSSDTLTLSLNRVSGRVLDLRDGVAGAAGYLDLADGPVYGSYVASATNNGTDGVHSPQFNIRLSEMAVRDINRSLHSGFGSDFFVQGLFAIGGTISDLPSSSGNAMFFGGGVPYASLFLNVRRYSAGCPMPSNTQYQ